MQVSFRWLVRGTGTVHRSMMPNPNFVPGLKAKIAKFERDTGLLLGDKFDDEQQPRVEQWFELQNSTSFARLFQRDVQGPVMICLSDRGHRMYRLDDKANAANELREQNIAMVAAFKKRGFRGTGERPNVAASVAQVDLYANLLSALEVQLVTLIQTVVPDDAIRISVVCRHDAVKESDEEAASGEEVASKRKRISID